MVGAALLVASPAAAWAQDKKPDWSKTKITATKVGGSVYFVHSYYAAPRNPGLVATETDYPEPFASAIWHENVYATQFHPEKSQRVGLTMLRNFGAL